MLQMKIYTFFFQQVSLFRNFDDDFLKNHAHENCSFFIMQIGTIGNSDNVSNPTHNIKNNIVTLIRLIEANVDESITDRTKKK